MISPGFVSAASRMSVSDALKECSATGLSDAELQSLIPRLYHAQSPKVKLNASPLEDLFILRAAVGDFEDVMRRLARGQNINATHSVRMLP
jgi:hypothetical protein